MKLVCEKADGLQANILACVYLMGKKSIAKSTWTLVIRLIIFSSTFVENHETGEKIMGKHMCWGWNPTLWEANTPPYVLLQKY